LANHETPAAAVPPSVLRAWEDLGGFLVRAGEHDQWRTVESLAGLTPGSQMAWYPELDEQRDELALPEGVAIVRVRPMRPSDIEEAPVSHSQESAYLHLDGYSFRISTHPPMTARSRRGLVLDVQLHGSAIEETWLDPDAGYVKTLVDQDEAERLLRLAALAWVKS
jgi:hypothetical protein